jgi:hypothetical protein
LKTSEVYGTIYCGIAHGDVARLPVFVADSCYVRPPFVG